ncbi:MAG TPA: polymer-forming cytoskeletal protein [Herpetosiphonaceae bacterium]
MFSRRDASTPDRTTTDDVQRTAAPSAQSIPAPQPAVSQIPTPQSTTISNPEESLVAREDTFEGQLRTTRGVRVLGTVRGGIESSQYVHIEENAHVEADITAEEVVIAGEYSGKLTCRQRVEIRSTGRVTGHLDTQKLLLHEGGYFDGELHMQKPADIAGAAPARTETEDNRPRRTRYVDLSSDTTAPREVGASDSTT